MIPRTLLVATLAGTFATGTPLQAEGQAGAPPPPRDSSRGHALDVVKVTGRLDDLAGTATSASEGRVGAIDLRLRPIAREGEMLEAVPGLIVTQHSGEGKANQYFVRGFNLDHGTDFQMRVDGMPVNLPTHVHGQGYSDLNFLMPEMVDYLDYKLGVYHAEIGDFGSAGGAEFHLKSTLDQPFVSLGGGANGLARLAAGKSSRVGDGDLLLGAEAQAYDGPWRVKEGIRKFSGLARYSWTSGTSQFSLLGMAYHNGWRSNDQVPLRAVNSGLIDRFGQIDSTDGGKSQRYSVSGTWRHAAGNAVQQVQLFGIYSDLTLFSDFTYFLDNPAGGDQFGQHDHRVVVGGNFMHAEEVQAFGVSHDLKAGLQSRGDLITGNGLFRTTAQVRTNTIRQDDVREWGTGAYSEIESKWRTWFRSVLGVRADAYSFDVTSDRAENSGRRGAGIVSPKASLIFAPAGTTEYYMSGGLGFHSNDARGTTITVDPGSGGAVQRVDPLVRSRGAEIGVRATPVQGWRSTLSLWALNLDSELLFIGDGGTTAPSAASERRGFTWANFYRPVPELSLDADVSFARARLTGVAPGQTHVPGALENVVAAGIARTPGEDGILGAVRVRHFGSYSLTGDNGVRASATTLLSADLGYVLRRGLRVQLTALNLLNGRAADIQYFYTSRLRGEPAGGVADIHFHPIEPRRTRLSLGWGF